MMYRSFIQILLAIAMTPLSCGISPASDLTPIAGWNQQLFPSYLIAIASVKATSDAPQSEFALGDHRSMLGVMMKATTDNQLVEVTISCDEFFEPSSVSVRLPEKGRTYSVLPKIKYRYDRLSQCRQSIPATITYRVKTEEKSEDFAAAVTFHSINDCPTMFRSKSRDVDTRFVMASYINVEHPYLEKLIGEALDFEIVDGFTGYKSRNSDEVLLQAYAIWDLLVARGIRCSSNTTTTTESDSIASQHVRLLEDTVNSSQGNCVDSAVLLASLLRKIGIDAVLLFEPDHCYVGFFLDRQREKLVCLDSTLLDAELEEPEEIEPFLDLAITEENRDEYSWPSFVESVKQANERLKVIQSRFDDPSQNEFFSIDLAEARNLGILAIPFTSKDEFVPYVSDEESEEESE